jgi:hypothetical protein
VKVLQKNVGRWVAGWIKVKPVLRDCSAQSIKIIFNQHLKETLNFPFARSLNTNNNYNKKPLFNKYQE